MSEETRLLPMRSTQTTVERVIARKILKINPGMGVKSLAMANDLAESGLGAAMASMLVMAVYSPSDELGRGQAARAKWLVEAVQTRYAHKLDQIRNDRKQFRLFVADVEEVATMRDTLAESGVPVSFHGAFLLWEIGMDADGVLSVVQEVMPTVKRPSALAAAVVKGALAVKDGRFTQLETAITEMNYGYRNNTEDY